MMRLAHLVNPFRVAVASGASLVQRVTFESIRKARHLAETVVDVELLAAHYPEDQDVVPPDFRSTRLLERSVLDVRTFREPRRLPLLVDLLDRVYEATDAPYVVFSNMDIGLMPHFYVAVKRLIENGYDGLVVNRRTISAAYHDVDDLPLMYTEIGEAHEGWDCFVYRRAMYPRFRLGTICVGAPRMGRTLVCNLVAHSTRFDEIRDAHLTFHLGNDRAWRDEALSDYTRHNDAQFREIQRHLEGEATASSRAMAARYFRCPPLQPPERARFAHRMAAMLRRAARTAWGRSA